MIWMIVSGLVGAIPITTIYVAERARRRSLKPAPEHKVFPETKDDERINALEEKYVDGELSLEELEHETTIILDPVARAQDEAEKRYQSDWVMAIHHNNLLDRIEEEKRLDEEYFFEHGKPRPKERIDIVPKVQPGMVSVNSAYATAVSMGYGWGSSAAVVPVKYIDLTDNRPKWAKDADSLRNRGICLVVHDSDKKAHDAHAGSTLTS